MSVSITGKENIPAKGPILVVANHLSVADPPILGAMLGRKILFMAKEELFKNWFTNYILRQSGAFPVRRGSVNREALRQATIILNNGEALALFPEGKRSKIGSMQNALPGSALIAIQNNATILPIGFKGTEVIQGFGWVFKRPKVYATIGKPFKLPNNIDEISRERLDESTTIIMSRIAEILPEKYRGKYSIRGN